MRTVVSVLIALLSVQLVARAEGTSAPPAQAEPPRKAEGPAAVTSNIPAAASASAAATAADVASLLSSGRQFLNEGKWTEAAALFEKVRSLDPANQEAAFGLSATYIENGRLEEALPLLERLSKEAPDNPMVKNNLAWVYVKAKDPAVRNPEKAVVLAREAVLDVPADYSVWNTLAEAYYAAGKYDLAARRAKIALQLSQAAGVTNDVPFRELIERCQSAAGAKGETTGGGEEKP